MRTKQDEENGEVLLQKGKKRKQDPTGPHVDANTPKKRVGNSRDSPAPEGSSRSTPQKELGLAKHTNKPSKPKHDSTPVANSEAELMETDTAATTGPSEQDVKPGTSPQNTPHGESLSQKEHKPEVTSNETAEAKSEQTVAVTTDETPQDQTIEATKTPQGQTDMAAEECGGNTGEKSTSAQVLGPPAVSEEGNNGDAEGQAETVVEAVSGAVQGESDEKDKVVETDESLVEDSPAAECKPVVQWQPSRGLYESVRFMFEGGICTDVTFSIGPEDGTPMDFKCHRNILAVRSEYFFNLFSKEENKVDVHRVTDVSPQAFQVVLRYLYCDDVDRRRTAEEDLDILYAAQKYRLPRLTKSLASSLEKKITTNNVLAILAWSLVQEQRGDGLRSLTDTCVNYIEDMTTEVFESHAFLKVPADVLLMLLKQEGLTAAEIDIFRRCLAWARAECHRRDLEPTTSNQRLVLGNILQQFNFNVLIMAGFKDEVVKSGLLHEDELREKQAAGE